MSTSWPYLPDLTHTETGFAAVRAMLLESTRDVRLINSEEIGRLNCAHSHYYSFKVPEANNNAQKYLAESTS
jgi:hypothetical protein